MRHTVIGLFDTYAQAENARNTLVQTGFASTDIELQANPETPADAAVADSPGIIANIERFLSSLFTTSGTTAPDAERYTQAVRRGAVVVAVSVASEAHADLARNSLTKLGAIEVSERTAEPDARVDPLPADSWIDPVPPDVASPELATPGAPGAAQQRREHSPLDELGLGTTAARPSGDAMLAEDEARKRAKMDALHGVPPVDQPSPDADAIYAASAPGAGAVMRPDVVPEPPPPPIAEPAAGTRASFQQQSQSSSSPNYAPATAPRPSGDAPASAAIASAGIAGSGAVMTPDTADPARVMPQQVPDEFLEYEEDFRTHYDAEYASEGVRYDEYVPAYHYGAAMAREIRYQDRPWEEVEPEVREDWERGQPVGSWERFKSAVRHGWDRVTGHHHH
jgi:hypothetical protein